MVDLLFNILLRAASWRFFLVAVIFIAIAWLLFSLNMAGTGVFFLAFVATIVGGGSVEILRIVRAWRAERERQEKIADARSRTPAAPHHVEGNDDVRS
jgi:hypothetical protein